MTSSRVPATLPGRPSEGKRRSSSTPRLILASTRAAAPGLSRAMYSVSVIRLATAARNHLTRTAGPLWKGSFYFLVRGEVPAIRFGNGLTGFLNLPIVQGHVLANRFGGHERAAAIGRL